MINQTELKMSKWAYIAAFAGDAALLGIAGLICLRHVHTPVGATEAMLMVFCGLAGAALAILPFVLEYNAAIKMVETGALTSTLQQIEHLEAIVGLIGGATSQWQVVQEHSTKSVTAAREISERMAIEAAAFTEFIKKANESEKTTLKLEVDKLRRGEGEWLQVVVRLLDHTYALHQAAVRSGQLALIEQLGQFQNACRDVVRRMGLVPFTAAANEPFDARSHQLADPKLVPPEDAKVLDTLATGYTFQGRLVRPAIVSLRTPAPLPAPAPAAIEESAPAPAKREKAVVVEEEQTLL